MDTESVVTDEISTNEESDSRVSEALDKYFSSISSIIGKENKSVGEKKQIDYFLSKRFLMTAYNNLRCFDPSIHEHKSITEKLQEVDKLQNAYYNLNDKDNVPEMAFEIIFLRSQEEYNQFVSDKEKYERQLSVFKNQDSSLIVEIKNIEDEIKKYKDNESKRSLLENELKPLKGKYVDGVEEIASLNEKLENMEDIKSVYTEKYYQAFVDELATLSVEYKKVLATILNHKAGELDDLIWENASKSKLIREYFCDAGIDGEYSTKTYLNYYINTLDKNKLGSEHKELTKFLNYLIELDKK
ncbi:hypothetical protein N9A28_10075 [Sulfurimonas sp.]|nr:hypothetical protein [Sulfurimonas sp.]